MGTTSFEEYADILNRILTRIYPDTVCLPDEEVERMLQAALDEDGAAHHDMDFAGAVGIL